jgi:hypothetical protein
MKRALMIVMFTVLLTSLIGFAIAEDSNTASDSPVPTLYTANSEDNVSPTIVGASCGTVSPGYQEECCINKGYSGWDSTNFICIGETPRDDKGRVVGGMMGAPREPPRTWKNNKSNDSNGVVCTMDAKLCQDGSYVSRVGPHCEFAPCPKPINVSKEKVCCKEYGYGAGMNETNVKYKIINKKECSIPEGLVGGNREIVNDSYCINQIKEDRQDFLDKKWEIMQDKNRIKESYKNQSECPDNCTCTGSAMKCEFENGTRVMTVIAGKSGNVIVQVKNTNASTNVTLYKADGKVYGIFKDNDTHQIILPDEVKDRIKEMMKDRRGKTSNVTDENITLNDTGTYHVEGKKHARLFWIIPVKEKVQFDINSETGEITKTKTKWWGFLARDVKEQDNSTN